MGGIRSPRSGSEAVTPPANGCAAAAQQTALGARVSVGLLQLGKDWRVHTLTLSPSPPPASLHCLGGSGAPLSPGEG